jgi:prepilin-type N-terminal cleavage/methylation domain-containing protein
MIRSMTAALARKRDTLGTQNKGFTLIELLVVVLILGVLAAVAIPIFLNQQNGAKDSSVATQITQAKSALAIKISDGGTVKDAVTAFNAEGAQLPGYSTSTEMTVKARFDDGVTTTTKDDSFTVVGWWVKGVAEGTNKTQATIENHASIITATTTAVPWVSPSWNGVVAP